MMRVETIPPRRCLIDITNAEDSVTAVPDPDDQTFSAIESAAREFIVAAGKIVTEKRANLKVDYKDARQADPVTEVDRAVEAYLTGEVAARFPGHAVLGEEGQNPEGTHEFEWIIDPVDGTLNYVTGLPLYAISIGVLFRRRPVVGVILFPTTGEMLWARRGGGAYRDGAPIHVRSKPEGKRGAIVALPVGYQGAFTTSKKLRAGIGETRSLGSIAYEMGVVAAGTLDLAAFRGPKIWDVAGSAPIVTEAGGQVLIHSKRLAQWHPLERFDPPPRGALRAWSRPVLVGAPHAVETLGA
ncbi:MAG: hypothetical protein M3506_04030, partial [Chloroflexota bacterium]|nr:hypothetical protein [Chloroflexota bacterium]